ncbi:MAG TPA: DUF3443 domain-containing protein [Terriglobales bacterium]|nr:DUF3443 domain-containing protein [Terriglobales bacterium]
MRKSLLVLLLAAFLPAAGCGGSSGSASGNNTITPPTTQNVQAVSVNPGPTGSYVNGLFTSVTVCLPSNSSDCQTISGVLVDTGSVGLRILASALTLPLPQQTNAAAAPIAECNQFEDGYTWGPIKIANIQVAGEQAASVPVQVIGDPAFSTVPSGCTSTGLTAEDNLQTLGANGVLGVGLFPQDCGGACTLTGSANPGIYYACPKSGCVQTAQGMAQQVQNPVSMFPADNNGVIIELPLAPSGGALSLAGSLVFGIGTQANNSLGNARVFTTDASGNISTAYGGHSYTSFLDTGSNALYFLDSTTAGLPVCTDASSFYCPASSKIFSATNQGGNGASGAVNFSVANADSLFATPNSAFINLAGPNPSTFDWGLPFFYGRNVFTAIAGQNTPGGPGPFFAY